MLCRNAYTDTQQRTQERGDQIRGGWNESRQHPKSESFEQFGACLFKPDEFNATLHHGRVLSADKVQTSSPISRPAKVCRDALSADVEHQLREIC